MLSHAFDDYISHQSQADVDSQQHGVELKLLFTAFIDYESSLIFLGVTQVGGHTGARKDPFARGDGTRESAGVART